MDGPALTLGLMLGTFDGTALRLGESLGCVDGPRLTLGLTLGTFDGTALRLGELLG